MHELLRVFDNQPMPPSLGLAGNFVLLACHVHLRSASFVRSTEISRKRPNSAWWMKSSHVLAACCCTTNNVNRGACKRYMNDQDSAPFGPDQKRHPTSSRQGTIRPTIGKEGIAPSEFAINSNIYQSCPESTTTIPLCCCPSK